MAFHPLTLLGAQRGRAERYSLLKGCKRTRRWQFKLLLANVLVLSRSSSQCSGLWPSKLCCDMGNRKPGSTTLMIHLLTLSGNATQDVGALNAGTFSIIHCPTLRDKGDSKFPLWLRLGAATLILQRKKRFVYQWPFLPQSPLPIPKTRKLWLSLKMTIF